MTQIEFESYYLKNSGMTIEEYAEQCKTVPCDCGIPWCEGWRATLTKWDVTEFLSSEEMIAEYLKAAEEENDPEFLEKAREQADLARARLRMNHG